MFKRQRIEPGTVFNDLTFVSEDSNDYAWFKCKCGVKKRIYRYSVIGSNPSSKSCGCRRVASGRLKAKHRMIGTTEYHSWSAAKGRCTNPNNHAFHRYGGRGITMCKEWREDFGTFFEHMGKKPTGSTLDRINNDGNYEPGNCRWARWDTQQNNRSNVKSITFNGETMSLKKWCLRSGISTDTFRRRIRAGMSQFDAVFTTPLKGKPIHSRTSP